MYSYFAPSSRAAIRREENCKAEFHMIKKSLEIFLCTGTRPVDPEGSTDHLSTMTTVASKDKEPKYVFTDVIPPSYHLTSVTYPSFRKFVEANHPGWKVVRRSVEDGEMETLPSNDRRIGKGKSYFIGFTYQKDATPFKSRAKKKKRHEIDHDDDEEEEEILSLLIRPSVKKAKIEEKSADLEGDKKPAAISRPKSFVGFSNLPEQLQILIMGYCDVETLGSVLLSSKQLNTVAKQDLVWEPHLKHMLRTFFDGSIEFRHSGYYFAPPVKDPVVTLTQRDDWRQVRINNNRADDIFTEATISIFLPLCCP